MSLTCHTAKSLCLIQKEPVKYTNKLIKKTLGYTIIALMKEIRFIAMSCPSHTQNARSIAVWASRGKESLESKAGRWLCLLICLGHQ